MNRTFTKNQIFDLTEEDGTVHLSSKPYKHSMTIETYILPYENKFWKVCFYQDYNEGWMLDNEVMATEVELVEKTVVVKEWITV